MDFKTAIYQHQKDWLNAFLDNKYTHTIVFIDEVLTKLHPSFIQGILENIPHTIILISNPEHSKSLAFLEQTLLSIDLSLDKKTSVLGIGGGAVTDFAGFFASIYKRGLEVHHIPSTLLGMIDASIGGKTALNIQNTKNPIGTTHLPKSVLLNTVLLETLSETEWLGGYAEFLKHELIAPSSFTHGLLALKDFHTLQKHISSIDSILNNQNIKLQLVEKDLYDKKERKLLNFGHTVGHAIESSINESGQVNHGIAIAAGLWIELEIAFRLKLTTSIDKQEVQSHIQSIFPKLNFDLSRVIEYMKYDKKNDSNAIKGIAYLSQGNLQIDTVFPDHIIIEALTAYRAHA